MHRLNLNGYEPDRHHEAAVAFCIHAGTDELTSPVHQHRKGQRSRRIVFPVQQQSQNHQNLHHAGPGN